MERAEEWAKRLGTTVISEEAYLQLRDRRVRPDMRGWSVIAIDAMSPSEVDATVAERLGVGEGLVGVLAPSIGHADILADIMALDPPLRREWEMKPSDGHREKTRLVFIKPDPHPELDDPSAVTFTPEDAIARAKERYVSRAVGPIIDVKAALMTAQEAYELVEHGTQPGRPGTVPGRLVCLVVIHGTFGITSLGLGVPRSAHISPRSAPTPPRDSYLFEVCDSRTRHIFWSGGHRTDIVLP